MSIQSDILHHLQCDYTKPVRDPLWKHIYLSEGMIHIIHSAPFQQLQRIKQLGPSYLVYPGAVHTRYNHSLGVFHIAKNMITSLIRKGSDKEVAQQFSLKGVVNFLLAALLHDLGHFPYAHSLKEVISVSHEALGNRLIQQTVLAKLIRNISYGDPLWVGLIIDDKATMPPHISPKDSAQLTMYRSLLSGPMDPDKLDYLNRDAFFCGVPYGIQDIDIAIETMLLGDARIHVDNLLFSKYLMYKQVYWHPRVRSATAMIQSGVVQALAQGSLHESDLYGLDDYSFDAITEAPLLQNMLTLLREGRTYRCCYESPIASNLQGDHWKKQLEEKLISHYAQELASGHMIIDIPEPISFEAPLHAQEALAPEDTPFTRNFNTQLSTSLRKLRIFAHPDIGLQEIEENRIKLLIHPIEP